MCVGRFVGRRRGGGGSGVCGGGAGRTERVAYVGEGGPDELRHDLDGVPALNEELDRGQLQLVPMNTLAGSEASVDPAVELPQLAAMTEDALVAGYRSLRVFAHGTSRVRDPAQRAQQVRYEHLIDRFCSRAPPHHVVRHDAAVWATAPLLSRLCPRVGP